ncbi:hypothetical protein B0A48_09111 [Cryoendolithus antarcticus]|uniref:E3 ubiquitin-protein ligase RNF216 UBA domain-containing protein n=1 Tax=Cryoendolithus antarcticus TaxID=1507870 RepID=A0A1V8T1N5_9PEZI|nr:hypothetical protein B0A48_09111 [Cryoendolithus antarcticus]
MDRVPIPQTRRLWKSKADFFRPFRSAGSGNETITPLYDPDCVQPDHVIEADQEQLEGLNAALGTLVDAFPDVEIEALREMLERVSEDSRAQIVAERLLTRKRDAVSSGMRARAAQMLRLPANEDAATGAVSASSRQRRSLLLEETFRGEKYQTAVKQLLYQEFKTLSHSTIKAVMAENNASYTLSRPTLQQLVSKAWRFPLTLPMFLTRRAAPVAEQDHPALFWRAEAAHANASVPAVRQTGSTVLDRELHELFVAPVITKARQYQLSADLALAKELNETEAEEAEATFDCAIPRRLAERALDISGTDDVWTEFQKRLTRQALAKSQMPLRRCPLCDYAEVEDPPRPTWRPAKEITRLVFSRTPPGVQVLLIISALISTFFVAPLLLFASVLYLLSHIFPPFIAMLQTSYARVRIHRRSPRFHCLNEDCATATCTTCLAPWIDPHTCFSNARTSLRTLIETSATAAIKRTCPRCHLSFVKASGCNKLVCNCGYTMCYTCRCEITAKEGYQHFCQHFRPAGGKCSQCERCELYGDEDEDAVVRRAVEKAEREWMEGGKGGETEGERRARRAVVEAVVGKKKVKWWEGWLDAVVDVLMEID